MQTDALSIYKASAGSGKTYTLTQEYLRLLLRPGTGARNILAITFTNAATADMKRKIVETLAELARGEYKDYRKLAEKDESQEALRKRAWAVLRELLHQYQDFSIKTIDSFVQNLIKPFAFELGLPQNYTPNVEETRLCEEITQKIIDDCGLPGMEENTEFLRRFLQLRGEQGKSLRITEAIQKVVSLLFEESSFDALESIKSLKASDFKRIISYLQTWSEDFEDRLNRLIASGKEVIKEHHLEPDHFHQGRNSLYTWFQKDPQDPDVRKKLIQSIACPTATIEKCVQKSILKTPGPASDRLMEIYLALRALDVDTYFLLDEVRNSIHALALVNRAEEILQEIKDTTSIIPISEFNKRIDKALSGENNNFIFERSGARYRHIFIDEFQDTSRLQWKNLRPLIEENLSQGNECLIVGDPKQSIYRFRNADMEQFVNLCQGKGQMAVKVHNLQSNWRSEPGIIAFNNAFYESIRENSKGLARTVFEDQAQFFKSHTDTLPQSDPEAVRLYIARNLDRENLENWYLEETLRIVKRFPPREVTVLCRKKSQCRTVADYLIANGIRVSTNDSLILSAHNGLNLLISSLQYMESRENYYKGLCFVMARQLGIWPQEGDDFMDEWENKAGLRFQRLVSLYEEQADVYDTVEAVLRFWGLYKNMDQYVLTFLDIVQESQFHSLSELLDWWTESAETTCVTPVNNQDCVQVMTIHKSKGLEFKVVVIPFVYDTKLSTQDLFWTSPGSLPRELGLPAALIRYVSPLAQGQTGADVAHEKQLIDLDNLNTLYVATTRARGKLFLLCAEPGRRASVFSSAQAICDFAEAHPEYVEKIEDGSVLAPQNEEPAQEPHPEIPAGDLPDTSPAPAPFSVSSWRQRMQAAHIDTAHKSEEMEWGNFIHGILSRIRVASPERLRLALSCMLNEYPRFKDKQDKAINFIHRVLEHPRLKPYFSKDYHIKSETGIAAANGLHIPDRVAIKGNSAVVLDYKTGAVRKSHREQLRQYMELLREMSLECRQGFIVYLGEELKVEEVS